MHECMFVYYVDLIKLHMHECMYVYNYICLNKVPTLLYALSELYEFILSNNVIYIYIYKELQLFTDIQFKFRKHKLIIPLTYLSK